MGVRAQHLKIVTGLTHFSHSWLPSSRSSKDGSTVTSLPTACPIVAEVSSEVNTAFHTFVQREDATRFVEEVRGDDPELASYLRIEERELGGRVQGPSGWPGPWHPSGRLRYGVSSGNVPSGPAGTGSGLEDDPGTFLPGTPLTDCVENANVSCANATRSLLTVNA